MSETALAQVRADLRELGEAIRLAAGEDVLADDFAEEFARTIERLVEIKTGSSGFYRGRIGRVA